MIKISLNELDKKLKSFNKIRLSDYDKLTDRGLFKCLVCEYIYEASFANMYHNGGCKSCSGHLKLTKDGINEKLKSRNIVLVDDYVNNKTIVKFKCLKKFCSHTWLAKPENVLHGTGCPKCAGNIKLTRDEVVERLKDKDVSLIGDYVTNRTKTLCQCKFCNHTWNTTLDKIFMGRRCPKCFGKNILTNAEVDKRLEGRNITRLDNYVNCTIKLRWRCDICGNVWDAVPKKVYRGTGCPDCKLKNETRIRNWLREKYGEDNIKKLTVRFNNRNYMIDFVVNGVFIEYNGEQHYQPIEFWGGQKAFEKQQKRDQELRDYCKENNIRLIEIPYWLSHEDQYNLLKGLNDE